MLDKPVSRMKLAYWNQRFGSDVVEREYGRYGEARQLFEEARAAGVVFLDEGNYQVVLENGALLNIYASPYTPSKAIGVIGGLRISPNTSTTLRSRKELTW